MAHDAKLGQIVDNPEAARDAIHIALAPVVAAQKLMPGWHVGLLPDGRAGTSEDIVTIGIVDPFLTAPVEAGQTFWMLLYQNTITSLRHAWTHPAFEGEGVGAEASVSPAAAISFRVAGEAWLNNCADELGISYRTLMEAADDWIDSGDYYCFRDQDTPNIDWPKFWTSWEHVTGRDAPKDRPSFFTCSC